MKTRLNLTIEEDLLQKVKRYASNKKVSISNLVEDYFKNLSKSDKQENIVDLMKRIGHTEIEHIPENIDYKEEYYKEKAKKYGI